MKVVPKPGVEVPTANCVPFQMKFDDEVRFEVEFQYAIWFEAPEPVRLEEFEMRQLFEIEKQPLVMLMPFAEVEVAFPVMVKPFVEVMPPTARPAEMVEVPAPET